MLNLNYRSDMCTHGRLVTNKYTKQQFWCKCGKCESCLQEKAAARASRVRAEYDGVSSVYFCTLTYDRLSCPYFKYFDLKAFSTDCDSYGFLTIYRGHSLKWNVKKQKYIKYYGETKLFDIPYFAKDYGPDSFNFKWLAYQNGKVGVCYFKDLQDFQKRFRERPRRQGFKERIRFFNVSEYGGKTNRPHFHFLLFAPSGYDEVLRQAFIASWPYGHRVRKKESFQLVRDDPAGYVASYVNGGNSVCEFLARNFASKHSASKYFGHGRSSFSLDSIEKGIDRGCLDYSLSRVVNGVPTVFDMPIPKYVVNRFFPLFKGYSRLTSAAVYDYITSGANSGKLSSLGYEYDTLNHKTPILYTNEDLHKISVRLQNAYCKYRDLHKTDEGFPSIYDYAIAYEKAWRVYKSTCYKYFVFDDSVNDFYKYDNICVLPRKKQLSLFKQFSDGNLRFIVDNNEKPHYVNKTHKMRDMFYKYCKQKDITNFCLANKYGDF